MQHLFESAFGSFHLQRYPADSKEQLRAWDAADEYLLNYLHSEGITDHSSLLIFNDGFGGLSLPLNSFKPVVISDSRVSQLAISANMTLNNLPAGLITLQDSLSPIATSPELVLLKIPKNQALLHYQLLMLRRLCTPDTVIIAAGMAKYITRSILDMFEKLLGSTHSSLAFKKARLVYSRCSADKPAIAERLENTRYVEEFYGIELVNHANLFSRQSLDIGARFFIKHFPDDPDTRTVIDLGCGNGVLGLVAAKRLPGASVSFCDESYMAIQSARESAELNFDKNRIEHDFRFYVDDCLSHYPGPQVDLILCNPPFHQQHAICKRTAWRMFSQSRKFLSERGKLLVVANRHLNYHLVLKRLFSSVKLIASDRKFVLFCAAVK